MAFFWGGVDFDGGRKRGELLRSGFRYHSLPRVVRRRRLVVAFVHRVRNRITPTFDWQFTVRGPPTFAYPSA